MKKTMIECAGVTDVVAQLKYVVEQGGVIDEGSIGGTGLSTFDYSFTYKDHKDEYHNIPCKGRVEFIKYLYQVISTGNEVLMHSLTAGGGRSSYYWYEADFPDVEEPTEPEVVEEEPEESDDAMPDASPAATDLAHAHGIDLREVEGSGKGGKINKPDVVKHLEKLQ